MEEPWAADNRLVAKEEMEGGMDLISETMLLCDGDGLGEAEVAAGGT